MAEYLYVPDIEDLAEAKQDGTSRCTFTLRAMRMQPAVDNAERHPAAALTERCPMVAAIAAVAVPDDFTSFLEHYTGTDSSSIEIMSDVLEQRLTHGTHIVKVNTEY